MAPPSATRGPEPARSRSTWKAPPSPPRLHRFGLRFACVRAVLDTVDEEIVGAELAGPDGVVRPLAAASFVLRNPAAVIGLARMMRSLNRATAALAAALEALSRPGA